MPIMRIDWKLEELNAQSFEFVAVGVLNVVTEAEKSEALVNNT